jgi:hypothetical protein
MREQAAITQGIGMNIVDMLMVVLLQVSLASQQVVGQLLYTSLRTAEFRSRFS